MRKLLFLVIGLAVLAVAAALVVPGWIDWNSYKGEIAAQVKAATGRDLIIDGELSFTVLPAPRLAVGGVRLANMKGAVAPDMARLESLEVRVRFIPLLQGRIEVASISLIRPVIELEVLDDGRANWVIAPKAVAKRRKPRRRPGPRHRPPPPAERSTVSAAAAAVRFDDVRIVDGTLIWRNAGAGTVQRVEKIDAQIAARSLAGPFRAKGGMVVRDIPITLEATVERLEPAAPVPLSLRFALSEAGTRGELSGSIRGLDDSPQFAGKVSLAGEDLAKLIAATGGGATPAWVAQPYALAGRIAASQSRIGLDDATVKLGKTGGTGSLTATIGARVDVKSNLKFNRIDLDSWLAMKAPGGKTASTPDGNDQGSGAGDGAQSATGAAGFTLPSGINGSLNIAVEAVTLYGGLIRGARINAALAESELTLNQASARLPGNAEVSLFGFMTSPAGQPKFEGSVEATANNLRDVLSWLGIDTTAIPADRLRRFSLAGKLQFTETLAHLLNASVRLDSSRIKGGVTVALRNRLSFGASASLDHLNLDAYFPPVPVAVDDKPGKPGKSATTGAGDGGPGGGKPGAPLAVLNNFDANVKLRIGSLNFDRTPIRGIHFDGTLAAGKLEVREAAVRNLAGSSSKLSGTLSNFQAFPVFKGKFSADSRDLTGLLRLVGVTTPVAPKRYGKARLRGSAEGGTDRLKLKSRLDVAGMTVRLNGDAENLATRPRFNATLNMSHPQLSRLAPLIGLGTVKGKAAFGPVGLTLSLTGNAASLKTEARFKAAGADFSLNGNVGNPLTAPTVDMGLDFTHREFISLMRTFDPSYKPASRALGRFALSTRIKGDGAKLQLGRLKAGIGKLSVTGEGTLALGGKRPRLKVRLNGGDIDINPFLAPPSKTVKPPARAGAAVPMPPSAPLPRETARAPFSAEPFDFNILGSLDADINVAAKALHYRTFTVTKPSIEAGLADRVLTLVRLGGRMYGGSFALNGKIIGGSDPVLSGALKITKANVGKALFDATNFDIAGGIMNFEMNLAAGGKSPRAMIASLTGVGRIGVADGVVRGFDLTRVSDRLKNLRRATDFLGLMGATMGGGDTKFSALDGTFRIDNGRLVSNDLKLLAKAGEGNAKGYANLPRWNLDFTTRFRLTEHPKAPPFGMRVFGPIDAPRRLFGFEKLQSFLLQRGVEQGLNKLLRRVAPGIVPRQTQPQQTQPQQTQPQPTQPAQQDPQEMKPKDVLRGLLKGLLTR